MCPQFSQISGNRSTAILMFQDGCLPDRYLATQRQNALHSPSNFVPVQAASSPLESEIHKIDKGGGIAENIQRNSPRTKKRELNKIFKNQKHREAAGKYSLNCARFIVTKNLKSYRNTGNTLLREVTRVLEIEVNTATSDQYLLPSFKFFPTYPRSDN